MTHCTTDQLTNHLLGKAAGTGSLHDSSRHLVFCSQNFILDLSLDRERSPRNVMVVGQLLNRDCSPLAEVPACLVSGDQVVSHSTTGRLGEFHMEGRPRGTMHLHLLVNDEELIDVELDQRYRNGLQPVLLDRDDLASPAEVPYPVRSYRTSQCDSRIPSSLSRSRIQQTSRKAGSRL